MRKVFYPIFYSVLLLLCSSFNAQASTTLNYSYDANGNMIQGDGKYFEYNDANQLVKVRHGDASGPVIAQYFYDYTGQRIKKIENGVTTYYVGKHYETQVSGNTVSNTSYYFANKERVAKKDPAGNIYYYHNDHLGGTNVVVDQSGNTVEHTRYFPFGEVREGGTDKYTYTGKERDKNTGSYYFEARYYKPELKHFTQADLVAVISNPQGFNRYAYVVNNPITLIDPTGHVWWNPFTWFNKKSSQNPITEGSIHNVNLATVLLPSSSTSPSIRDAPLDNMKKGGFGYNKPGYHGVTYRGDGPGGVNDGMHNGIDLQATPSTLVMAPEHGMITKAEYKINAGGFTITFQGDSGYQYIFSHLEKNSDLTERIKTQQISIDKGNPLGEVGPNYGNEGSSGPHLHLGVIKDGKYVDPGMLFDISN